VAALTPNRLLERRAHRAGRPPERVNLRSGERGQDDGRTEALPDGESLAQRDPPEPGGHERAEQAQEGDLAGRQPPQAAEPQEVAGGGSDHGQVAEAEQVPSGQMWRDTLGQQHQRHE
jgi:hypothetical protein